MWAARSHTFRRRYGPRCEACHTLPPPRDLHVHHISYANAFHGTEPDEDLRCLCTSCHNLVHDLTTTRGGPFNLRDATNHVINGAFQRGPAPHRNVRGGLVAGWVLWILGVLVWLANSPFTHPDFAEWWWAIGLGLALTFIGLMTMSSPDRK